MADTNAPQITCAGGCGLKSTEPEAAGWECLPITGRYRCGACTRQLQQVGRLVPLAEKRCEYCDGTGDVHRADGEWLGACSCPLGLPAAPSEAEGPK